VTAIWHFYWPVFVAAVVIGLAAGVIAFRKPGPERRAPLAAGALSAVLVATAWHLLSAGDRLGRSVEQSVRTTLANYEMDQVTAQLERGPLSRTIILSGPADDFQRRELIRILDEVPGVSSVRWDRPLTPTKGP
jgi:hypothetical protein